VGGKTGAHENPGPVSGSTYDDPEAPSQPGGGGGGEEGSALGNAGGGVLDVTVQTLKLEGVLAADGQSGDGPTLTEPAPFDFTGGAGAGGSVYVHATSVTGAGKLTALGGTACIAGSPPLLVGAGECGLGVGAGGGGGGGRVALLAGAACGWTGSLSAAGGVDSEAELNAEAEDAEAMRGSAGSVFFPVPSGACLKEEAPPKKEEAPAKKAEEVKPPAQPVSSAFAIIARKTIAKTATEILTISVPGAGLLTGIETAKLSKPRKHHPAAKAETVAKARTSTRAPARVKLTLTLSKAARSYLAKHGKLTVTIRVGYAPIGGKAASKTLTLTLHRAKH
jgi:hypothetical protein